MSNSFLKKVLACVVFASTTAASAQQYPIPEVCAPLTRERIAQFKADLGTRTPFALELPSTPPDPTATRTGAIEVLYRANQEAGPGYAANPVHSLQEAHMIVDENAFDTHPCQSLFYPASTPHYANWPSAINLVACFRLAVMPHLEYAKYGSLLHVWYNKSDMPSRSSALEAFEKVNALAREAKQISIDASNCLLKPNDSVEPPVAE
ncbi:MAG: hypothetical protein ACRCWJ_11730 [Casimicrobium sp.]